MSDTTKQPDPDEQVEQNEEGVGLGMGEPSTFEPEEDTESVPEDPKD